MAKYIQLAALLIGVATYLFWNDILKTYQIPVFYIGNALFIFILCALNYIKDGNNIISFLLICLSFSNLLDELFFDNTKLGDNEITLALILPIIWLIKRRSDAGKNSTK